MNPRSSSEDTCSARRSGASVLGLAPCPRAPRSRVSLPRPARSSWSPGWPAPPRGPGPDVRERRQGLVPVAPYGAHPRPRRCKRTTRWCSSGRTSRWRRHHRLRRRHSRPARGRGLLRRAPGRERGRRPLVRVERNRPNSDRPRPRRPRRGARRGGAGRTDRSSWSETPGGPTSTRMSLSFATRRPASSIRASRATGSRRSTSARRTSATDAAVQLDGKIVAVATTSTYDGFEVVRLNADGSPDQSFGSGGVVRTPIGEPVPRRRIAHGRARRRPDRRRRGHGLRHRRR